MKLPEVDPIGLETSEAVFEVGLGIFRGPAADLGHQEDLIAPAVGREGLPHARFGLAVVVIPAVVHEGDSFIDGALDELDTLSFGHRFGIGAGVSAEAKEADRLAGLAKRAERDTTRVRLGGLCLDSSSQPDGGHARGGRLEELSAVGVGLAHGLLVLGMVGQNDRA